MEGPRDGTAQIRTRHAAAALIAALAATFGAPVIAACSGTGCPEILSLDLQECPGRGCPAFRETVESQQKYIDIVGALQSEPTGPRSLEGRLLLGLTFAEDETALSDSIMKTLPQICSELTAAGALRAEIVPVAPANASLAKARADTFARSLSAECGGDRCTALHCPTIEARPALANDGLPSGIEIADGVTVLELQLLP